MDHKTRLTTIIIIIIMCFVIRFKSTTDDGHAIPLVKNYINYKVYTFLKKLIKLF